MERPRSVKGVMRRELCECDKPLRTHTEAYLGRFGVVNVGLVLLALRLLALGLHIHRRGLVRGRRVGGLDGFGHLGLAVFCLDLLGRSRCRGCVGVGRRGHLDIGGLGVGRGRDLLVLVALGRVALVGVVLRLRIGALLRVLLDFALLRHCGGVAGVGRGRGGGGGGAEGGDRGENVEIFCALDFVEWVQLTARDQEGG